MARYALNFIFLVCLLLNISFITCDDGSPNCPSASLGADTFIRTGPYSKYLYNPKAKPMNFRDIKKLCGEMGLEMAEVRNMAELNHLKNFTIEQKITGRNWALGITDVETEGEFLEEDGTLIRFQAFWDGEPDNGGGGSHCIELDFVDFDRTLNVNKAASPFAMFDVPCSTKAFPLCQWLKSNPCNYESPISTRSAAEPRNGLTFIGETSTRRYFVSSEQKPWGVALAYCAENRKLLADFANEDSEIEILHTFANNHIYEQGLHEYNGYWTSGKYFQKVDGNNFQWQSTGTSFTDQKNISYTSWGWDLGEPRDASGHNVERCIVYFAPTIVGQHPKPLLSASNCNIPYFFMCYETAEHQERKAIMMTTPQPDELENDEVECVAEPPPILNVLEGGLSVKDIITFALYNIKNQLQSNVVTIELKSELAWRLPIINIFADITKTICPTSTVEHGFLNVMKNAMIVYYHSINYAGENINNNKWKNFLNDLNNCHKTINPLNFVSRGLITTGYTLGRENTSEAQTIGIQNQQETIDSTQRMPDLVIDTFWYMFTLSAGACHPTIQGRSKTEWMAEFFFYFNQDFLTDFINRWDNYGEVLYGALVGDFDVYLNHNNLRACSAAIFETNRISHMYYAKPSNN